MSRNLRKEKSANTVPLTAAPDAGVMFLKEPVMINEIEKRLPGNFEKDLFLSALDNLKDNNNALRFNNFSYAMRELTRHILHRLAPDISVLKCSWYKNETDKLNGITRKQRAIYAVQGGLEDSYVGNVLGLKVSEIHKNLIRSINKLSKFTHIEPKTFDLPENEVNKLVEETICSVYAFLQLINECKDLIIKGLWEQIDQTVVEEIVSETIQSLDELATHHYIDESYIDSIVIYCIDHEHIQFRAIGTVSCELQYGSNSDFRRGDGVKLSESFPFNCELNSSVKHPSNVESIEGSLDVDTDSWYE